jgi:FkbM family methyltransferase
VTASDPKHLIARRHAHTAGELARDVFWQEMRDSHMGLRSYQPLLAEGEVEALEITASGLVLRLKSGLKLHWNPENRREPGSAALNHGVYEDFAGRVLNECASRASLIVDAGANVGWYALRLATGMADGGRVVAFEPVQHTSAALRANIALNGLGERIAVVQSGLSDKAGEAEIFLPADTGHVGASLENLHPDEESLKETIKLTTLDEAMSTPRFDRLDLIKCDVEGAELMVLRGGETVIGRDRPVLFLEILRKWSAAFGYQPNDILSWTTNLGYACWAIGESGLRHIQTVDDTTPETNYIFVQPERDFGLIDLLK